MAPIPPGPAPKSTGMPRLEGSALDLGAFRAHSRTELLAVLDSIPPPSAVRGRAPSSGHALVLDPSLSGPLGLVAEVKEFKEHGIDKIYHLLPDPLVTDCTSIVYFIRPQLHLAEQVASQIRALEKSRGRGEPQRAYTLFFVPRRSMLCEKVLEDEGVYGLITVREFAQQLFVLEDDVLSLEEPHSFRECFLHQDRSILHSLAAALSRLQALYGTRLMPEPTSPGPYVTYIHTYVHASWSPALGSRGCKPPTVPGLHGALGPMRSSCSPALSPSCSPALSPSCSPALSPM